MARLPRSTARRRAMAALTASATVAGGFALLAPGTSSASSHREAPFVAGDATIDNTDTYAFVAPDKTDSVTLVANWSPFQDPSGGPNFYSWATDAAYDINVDNDGDAKADITYRWTFKDVDKRGTTDHGDNAAGQTNDADEPIAPSGITGSFLYNDGPVTSLTDPNLLYRQTYTLSEISFAKDGKSKTKTLLANKPVAPSHVGDASIPSYANLRTEAVAAGVIPKSGGKSYVGQSDDAFFLDLRVFDLVYGADFGDAGNDTLSRYNVNTIALQVPKKDVAAKKNAGANPVIGVWSTTSRLRGRALAATGAGPAVATAQSGGELAQVSRLGNPLVNEVVVPAQLKDYFNRSRPGQDGALLGKVQNPELPHVVELLYGIPNPNRMAGGNGRPDLVSVFLTGVAGLNNLNQNAIASSVAQAPAEYLRLNMSIAPTATPNRLGVLAGDNAGFPNGRRLTDDVLDQALQVAQGVLLGAPGAGGLSDGVDENDKAFLSVFPYVADPHSGSSTNRDLSAP